MKKVFVLIILFLILTGGIGFIISNANKTSRPEVKPQPRLIEIKVVSLSAKNFQIPIIIAKEKGFFKKYNLNVALNVVSKNITSVLIGKQADIAIVGANAPLAANVQGADLLWIGSIDNDPLYAIISYKQPDQIKTASVRGAGKNLAISLLKTLNVDTNKIIFQDANSSDIQIAALTENKIDAIGISKLDWLIAENKNNNLKENYKILIDTSTVDKLKFPGAIIVKNSYLKNSQKQVKDFSKAVIEAIAWTRSNPKEATDILAKEWKIASSEAVIYVDTYNKAADDLVFTPDIKKAETMVKLLIADNPKAKDYPADKYISTEIADSLKRSGFLNQFGFK